MAEGSDLHYASTQNKIVKSIEIDNNDINAISENDKDSYIETPLSEVHTPDPGNKMFLAASSNYSGLDNIRAGTSNRTDIDKVMRIYKDDGNEAFDVAENIEIKNIVQKPNISEYEISKLFRHTHDRTNNTNNIDTINDDDDDKQEYSKMKMEYDESNYKIGNILSQMTIKIKPLPEHMKVMNHVRCSQNNVSKRNPEIAGSNKEEIPMPMALVSNNNNEQRDKLTSEDMFIVPAGHRLSLKFKMDDIGLVKNKWNLFINR